MNLWDYLELAPGPLFLIFGGVLVLLSLGVYIVPFKIDRQNHPHAHIYAGVAGIPFIVLGLLAYSPVQELSKDVVARLFGDEPRILRDRISNLNSALENLEAEKNSLNAELKTLQPTLGEQAEKFAQIKEKILVLTSELQKKDKELFDLKSRIQTDEKFIKNIEKGRNTRNKKIRDLTDNLTKASKEVERLKSELKTKNRELSLAKRKKDVDTTGKDKEEKKALSEKDQIRNSQFQVNLVFSHITKRKSFEKLTDILKSEGFRVNQRKFRSGLERAFDDNPQFQEIESFLFGNEFKKNLLKQRGITTPSDLSLKDMLTDLKEIYGLTNTVIDKHQSAAIVYKPEAVEVAKKIQSILLASFWRFPLVEHEGFKTPTSFEKYAEVPLEQRILIYFMLR